MAYTAEQLKELQTFADTRWWFQSDTFKNYVDTTKWAWSYDAIKGQLQTQQNNIANTTPVWVNPMEWTQNIATAPISQNNVWKIDTATWQEVQAPVIPQKAPEVAKPIDTAQNITETINPKWQQPIDSALESWDTSSVKSKLDEWLKNWTLDQNWYNQANNYLQQKEQLAGDQKAQLENDQNYVFNALMTGQKIPNFRTPEAIKAKSRYDIASKYIWMTEDQIYNAYVNGEIGSQLEKDIWTNPYLGLAKEKYNKKLVTDNINRDSQTMLNAYNKVNGWNVTKSSEKTPLEVINDKMLNLFTSMWKSDNEILSFKEHLANNYPDLVTQTTELNAKSKILKEKADARDERLDEIIKENPWISINRATMLAARQNKDLNNEIKSMSYELNELSSNIQYQTNMADKEYGYLQQEQARQDNFTREQRGYAMDILKTAQSQEFAKEQTASDRTYNEAQATKQLEQKVAYTYWDINSKNPTLQNVAIENAVAWMYENYPIKWMESQATKVQKVKDRIAQGMTWAEAIASVEQEIRNSPAYKTMMDKQKADMTPTATTPKVEKVWTDVNGKDIYATYNATTQKYDPISINSEAITSNGNVDFTKLDFSQNTSLINQYPKEASFKNNNPTWITWGISANTKKLLEDAWINYSVWTARPASEWWNYIKFDSVQDWLDAYMVMLTQAWTSNVYDRLKQWVWTSEWDSYATNLMSQAWITKWAKFSDLSEEQLSWLMSVQLKKESPNFFKELSNMPTETTYTAEVKSWWDNIINWVWWAKITSIQDKGLRTQVSNYIAQKSKAEPNKEVSTIKSALTLLNELETHPGLEWAIWLWTKWFIPATPSASFMAKLSQLEAQQFLEWIQQMKWMWALSNAEWQKVSAAASSLINTRQSEKEWKAELQKIKDILQGKISTIEQTTWLKFDDMWSPTTWDMEMSNNWTDLRSKYFPNN